MTAQEQKGRGSATTQGALWGARARDWAEIQEPTGRPLYQAVLQRSEISSGTSVLDVGCGSGLFCRLVADRGAEVAGVDAAEALIAIAKARVPEGDCRVEEMEHLPHANRSFDVVTGFNSFQYAANPVNALGEAHRVARHGAMVFVATWGPPEDCEAAAYLAALKELLPPPPPGAPGPFALSSDGALKALAMEAGLEPVGVEIVDMPFAYPDEQTALRGLLSAGPAVRAIHTSGESRVRQAVLSVLGGFKSPSGDYIMRNRFLCLAATA